MAAALDAALPGAITGGHAEHNEPTLWIDPAQIVVVCQYLKDQQKFVRLSRARESARSTAPRGATTRRRTPSIPVTSNPVPSVFGRPRILPHFCQDET